MQGQGNAESKVLGSDLDLSLFFIACCVNLDVCLDFSEPRLPHMESGMILIPPDGVVNVQ